jgi:hypothetical protein
MKHSVLSLMIMAGLLVCSPARGAGLWLYEMGTPDLGTAAAERAAMASPRGSCPWAASTTSTT